MRQDQEGNCWFVSRKKDLIIRGGSNIWPVEVERALLVHPAVRDAAVVGVPDAKLGQRVAGFVQLADEPKIALAAIQADLATRLADYKIPERWVVIDRVPRNGLGGRPQPAVDAASDPLRCTRCRRARARTRATGIGSSCARATLARATGEDVIKASASS
jgi:long-chain acyl-CoA synthetase